MSYTAYGVFATTAIIVLTILVPGLVDTGPPHGPLDLPCMFPTSSSISYVLDLPDFPLPDLRDYGEPAVDDQPGDFLCDSMDLSIYRLDLRELRIDMQEVPRSSGTPVGSRAC